MVIGYLIASSRPVPPLKFQVVDKLTTLEHKSSSGFPIMDILFFRVTPHMQGSLALGSREHPRAGPCPSMWLLHCGDLWGLWRNNALWLVAQLSVGPTFAVCVFRVSSLLAASETVIFQPSSGVFLPVEPTKTTTTDTLSSSLSPLSPYRYFGKPENENQSLSLYPIQPMAPPRRPRGGGTDQQHDPLRGPRGGGINKRRQTVPDRDGDVEMSSAPRISATPSSSRAPTAPARGGNRGGRRPNADRTKANLQGALARELAQSSRDIFKAANKDPNKVTIRIRGLKDSKAATNSDGGLRSLLEFLERKASKNRQITLGKVSFFLALLPVLQLPEQV